MIEITGPLVQQLLAPDAHKLTVVDFGCTFVNDGDGKQIGLVLECEHPELDEHHTFLVKMTPTLARQLVMVLAIHHNEFGGAHD